MAKETGPEKISTRVLEFLNQPENKERALLYERLNQADQRRFESYVTLRERSRERLKALGAAMLIGTIVVVTGLLETPLDAIPVIGDAVSKGGELVLENALTKLLFGNKWKNYKELLAATGHTGKLQIVDGLTDLAATVVPGINPSNAEIVPLVAMGALLLKEAWDQRKAEKSLDQLAASLSPEQNQALQQGAAVLTDRWALPVGRVALAAA